MHIDIGYGCSTEIGGAKYALFMVDIVSGYKYIFKLKYLQKDTIPAFKKLITDMGFAPNKLVTDFDHKLMGKSVTDYLSTFQCKVESALPQTPISKWIGRTLLAYGDSHGMELANLLPSTIRLLVQNS